MQFQTNLDGPGIYIISQDSHHHFICRDITKRFETVNFTVDVQDIKPNRHSDSKELLSRNKSGACKDLPDFFRNASKAGHDR